MPEQNLSPTHRLWLAQHALNLLSFGRHCPQAVGGSAWLDEVGAPRDSVATATWITCRMVHVYSIGALLGVPGATPVARQALAGLSGRLHDTETGGWFHAIDGSGTPAEGKSCYDHAFVLLAASSALLAGLTGAAELLDDAQAVFLEKFWDEENGRCVDTWDTGFSVCDPYRGANANMHAVEAMLAVGSVTSDTRWIQRAVRICRFVAEQALAHEWRIPEHYDESWRPVLEYNRDRPDDQFKPFGATVGHGLEWSRLFLHAEAALAPDENPWLLEGSIRLFDRAVEDGWFADGLPGFVYTTDWTGDAVVRDRLHWVVAEAINAAAALHRRTGQGEYLAQYLKYWDHAAEYFVDHEKGSWRHQLSSDNKPNDTVWAGKPDLYHAFQAALGPRLPLWPMIAPAIATGRIE